MKSKSPLMQLDAFCTLVHQHLDKQYSTYQEKAYYERYRDLETELWKTHTQLFFYFVTGEPDFNAFYDRLQKRVKGGPIGWDEGGFIPDQISNLVWTDDHSSFKERWAKVEKLYKKGIDLEKRSHDLKNRSKRRKAT